MRNFLRRKDASLWKVGRLRCSFISFGSVVGGIERLPNSKRKAAILFCLTDLAILELGSDIFAVLRFFLYFTSLLLLLLLIITRN